MEGDFVRIGVDEVSVGKETEVGVDFVRADAGNRLRDEVLLGHFFLFLQGSVKSFTLFEPLERSPVQGGVQRVLVTIPEVSGGAARVAKRVDVKVSQALGGAHQFRKRS